MSYKLRGTGNYKVNIPNDILNKLGWNLNDEVDILISGEYGNNAKFTHNTITIERVVDYKKYYEEEEE